MTGLMTICEFRPLSLILEKIGPFREPYEISLMHDLAPCNFFMIVAANGFGNGWIMNVLRQLLTSSTSWFLKVHPSDYPMYAKIRRKRLLLVAMKKRNSMAWNI